MESKHDRFVRIAESRTNKIIDMIRLLGNCSNKGNYDYSDVEIRQIFSAIDSELKIAKSKFTEAENTEKKFSFR